MKLTRWEVEQVLAALAQIREQRAEEGHSTKNLSRLYDKVVAYGEMKGAVRGKN